MPDMTLQEALQTDEVQSFLAGRIQEAVADLDLTDTVTTAVREAVGGIDFAAQITQAVEQQLPTLRESVRDEVRTELQADNQVRVLHTEAVRLIEAAPLRGAAKQNLLDDYGLEESDDENVTPGRALRLVEAETDADGTVVKTARQVLRESVEADIKRARNVLREAAPTVPVAPGASDAAAAAAPGKPDWVQRAEAQGLDLKSFGYEPAA